MDSRDGCPDCGSEDHHGCDWPVRARAAFVVRVRSALSAWFSSDPGDDYLDQMAEFLVARIRDEDEPHVGEVTPADAFWQGYKRPPQMSADLVAALSTALYAQPEQRLGQLLRNLTCDDDLFLIYDEDLLRLLRDARRES